MGFYSQCHINACLYSLIYIQKKKKMHLPLSSAVVIDLYTCSQHELFSVCFLDSVDPNQTGPSGAVLSSSTLFVI